MIAIFIGGGGYPDGGDEVNIKEDLVTARIIFASPINIWQIPITTYRTMEISLSELVQKVKPCGKIGAYLCQQMLELNEFYGRASARIPFPHGESWCLGDNPTISVLLQSESRVCWHIENAPFINDDLTYSPNSDAKKICVYDYIDSRMTLEDLFAKLKICYG